MKDAEDLVGIDGAQGQVVVRVAAIVEVESAQQVCVQQPGDNLFNVLRGVVVAGVDQDAGLRSGCARQMGGHAPVGNIGVIESRLKGLVFDQQALVRSQR